MESGMKIWTMKIECASGCYLEELSAKVCEIANTFTLEELCYFILDNFDFDNDHLHEFFISRSIRNRSNTIDDEFTTLDDIFPLEKNHSLFMNFDFGDDWMFKITRSRKQAQFIDKISYPRVIEHLGKNPEQYPMSEDWN